MSTFGITSKQLLNSPVVTRETAVVKIAASAAAELGAAVQAALEAMNPTYGSSAPFTSLLISNNSITPIYVDTSTTGAHVAGEGIVIGPNGSLQLPWAEVPHSVVGVVDELLVYEAASPFYVLCFF